MSDSELFTTKIRPNPHGKLTSILSSSVGIHCQLGVLYFTDISTTVTAGRKMVICIVDIHAIQYERIKNVNCGTAVRGKLWYTSAYDSGVRRLGV